MTRKRAAGADVRPVEEIVAQSLQVGGGPLMHEVEAAAELQPIALRSMFWRPAYLADSPWMEQVPFGFWLVEAHRPKLIVELGVGGGTSYFAFCQAVERLGLDARCFGVDAWEDEGAPAESPDFDAVMAHNEAHYSSFSRILRGSFDASRRHFAAGSIDLLHIDGTHTIEAVTADFESWAPKLSDRAVVLLHASNVREPGYGVHQLFERLKARFPSFEFVHGQGLALLGVGPQQNRMLRQLYAAADRDDAQWSIRDVFARLGRACQDSYRAKHERQRALVLASRADDDARAIAETTRRLDETRQQLEAQAAELDKTREKLALQVERHALERGQLSERITMLQEMQAELRGQLAQLRSVEARAVPDAHAGLEDRLAAMMEQARRQLEEAEARLRREGQAAHDSREQALAQRAADSSQDAELVQAERSRIAAETDAMLSARDQAHAQALAQALAQRDAAAAQAQAEALAERDRAHAEALARRDADLLQAQAEALARREAELNQAHAADQARREAELLQAQAEEHGRTLADREREWATDAATALAVALDARTAELEASARARVDAAETRADAATRAAEQAKRAERNAAERHAASIASLQADLVAERQRAQDSAASAKSALETERAARTKVEASIQARFNETAQLTRRLLELQEQLAVVTVKQSGAEQARQELETEVRRLRRQLAASEAAARLLRTEARVLASRLDFSLKEKTSVAKAFDALRGSRTWRLTSPLRALRGQPVDPPVTAVNRDAGAILRESGLFDAEWYLSTYPDVAAAGIEPLEHYLVHGASEGREPGPDFDGKAYLAANPDVAEAGANPLLHYLEFGHAEGRQLRSEG
jgi:hypothetical protein